MFVLTRRFWAAGFRTGFSRIGASFSRIGASFSRIGTGFLRTGAGFSRAIRTDIVFWFLGRSVRRFGFGGSGVYFGFDCSGADVMGLLT